MNTSMSGIVHPKGYEMTNRELLKPEQAAEVLKISRSLLYELLKAGVLPSVKIGRSRRIERAEIDAFVASLTSTSQVVS